MKHFFDLRLFDESPAATGAAAPETTPAGGSQKAAESTQPAGTYSYAQAEEIATARAEKAERAALASYFKQSGLNEDQVTEAIKAYKAAQKAKEPDVATLTRERDEARAKAEAYEHAAELSKKGVKPEFTDFVAYKVSELMKTDDKLDTFEKAADKYLKDNPHYTQGKPAYKVKTATDAGSGNSQGTDAAAKNKAALNAALKQAALRRR